MIKFIQKLGKIRAIWIYCALIIIQLTCNILVIYCYDQLKITKLSQHVAPVSTFPLWKIIILMPFAAGVEELCFRTWPILIITLIVSTYKIDKQLSDKKNNGILIITVLISSILFGWAHGSIYNILLQGVSGVIMYIIFLRSYFNITGSSKLDIENPKSKRALGLSTIQSSLFHLTFNWIILLIIKLS